ncbi:SURF1 family protein [Microbacterium suaedae]|uniref:SURF1 family protein n=1 Tax=Microbacterium suaedae TaxID=2067813 RepID=UPI000DAF1ABF|nr:SURF1 family cytochrome oxidase biogenesis protein [Microbacterium suaedae]
MTDVSAHDELSLQEFPPTLREVMLRPRWIGMLVLCLVVAGIFAGLLQWQLSRAIATNPLPEGATENVLPIDEVVATGDYLPGPLVGQRVELTGAWSATDFLVVSERFNDGAAGFWVTGRLVTEEGASLATAIGWAPDRAAAEAAAAEFAAEAGSEPVELTGRLVADEGPTPATGDDPYEMTRMSPAALLGQWSEVDGPVYRPFLAAADATGGIAEAGLETISSPAPSDDGSVNWLNLFYAAEWAIFAAFSFYLWYRLAKDAWERELEEIAGIDPDDLDEE